MVPTTRGDSAELCRKTARQGRDAKKRTPAPAEERSAEHSTAYRCGAIARDLFYVLQQNYLAAGLELTCKCAIQEMEHMMLSSS